MRPNSDQTSDSTGDLTLSIADAADRLGMTSEAVRMRLKRGTLTGAKVDGHWVVYLPVPEQSTERDQTANQTIDPTPTEQPTERDQTALVSVYETLVASQREEIAFLRDQLDKRSRELADERERSDVLHREAFARIEALTAGLSTNVDTDDIAKADDDNDADSLARARVRARENAGKPSEPPQDADHLERVRAYVAETSKTPKSPQAAQDASGATEAASPSDQSNKDALKASRSVLGDLWAWVRGR